MSCKICKTPVPPFLWIECGCKKSGKYLCKSCYESEPWHCPACGSTTKPVVTVPWRDFGSEPAASPMGKRKQESAMSLESTYESSKAQMLHKGSSVGSSLIQHCPLVSGSMPDMEEEEEEFEEEDEEEDEDEIDDLLEVHFLDIGMGDSTLIICLYSGYTVLIDCGSTMNAKVAGFAAIGAIRKRLIELAKERGWPGPKIDRVYITHADSDHYNLLSALLNFAIEGDGSEYGIEVNEFYLGGQLSKYTAPSTNPFDNDIAVPQFKTFVSSAHEYDHSYKGDDAAETIDGYVQVQVLSANAVPTHGETPVNASSLCILFSVHTEQGIKKLLFMGDAEATVEERLVKYHADAIGDCCALKLGHHGAEKATNDFFLAKVKPKYGFVSADMRWSHPYTSVVERVLESENMQRFGENDPSHGIVHGTGGTRKRAYVRNDTPVPFYTSLTGFWTDTSDSEKAVAARKKGDTPVVAEGTNYIFFVCKDGTFGIKDSESDERYDEL